jgi:hypothetical protein
MVEGVASCIMRQSSDGVKLTHESLYIDIVGLLLGTMFLVAVLYPQYLPPHLLNTLTKTMVTATGTLDFFALN